MCFIFIYEYYSSMSLAMLLGIGYVLDIYKQQSFFA